MNGVVGRLKTNHPDKLPDVTQAEDSRNLKTSVVSGLNPDISHDSVDIKACT